MKVQKCMSFQDTDGEETGRDRYLIFNNHGGYIREKNRKRRAKWCTNQLVGDIRMVIACHSVTDSRFHQTWQRGQHVDWRIDLKKKKMAIHGVCSTLGELKVLYNYSTYAQDPSNIKSSPCQHFHLTEHQRIKLRQLTFKMETDIAVSSLKISFRSGMGTEASENLWKLGGSGAPQKILKSTLKST